MKMRVADYVTQVLVERGIRDVFLVTGGGAMHLNDAIGRRKELNYVCCHHEQACAMAAESYYRLTNRVAAVNVTSGPGGTNAITGVYGAFVDSLAMVVLSGQVKFETTVRSTNLPLRQLGDQELDIVPIVKTITKYAAMVTEPESIRYHLEKALYLATSGRPGPVWLDIPLNVQGALVETDKLRPYDLREDEPATKPVADLTAIARQVVEHLQKAKRPVVFVGAGVRIGGAQAELLDFLKRWQIPVVTGWNAHDIIWNSHPQYAGRPGTIGDRAGNFVVQNSDLLLVLGSRLNIRQVSYGWKTFARAAYKIMVDIDAAELKKPTITPDLPVNADVRAFLRAVLAEGGNQANAVHAEWMQWALARRERYPAVLPEYWEKTEKVNPYCFGAALFKELGGADVVVTGDGSACVTTFQAADIKQGQRLYTNSGCASMGYDLPGAIGACFGNGRKRTVCIAGDGSIQMNLQELQTIVTHRLPIKIFVLNNNGYHSIRQTQQAYFSDSPMGYQPDNGVGMPSFEKLAHAYDIPYRAIRDHAGLAAGIRGSLEGDGPQLCEVFLDETQTFSPKLSSRKLPDGRMVSAPLEDMFPFLPRDEFRANMIIPPLEESQ